MFTIQWFAHFVYFGQWSLVYHEPVVPKKTSQRFCTSQGRRNLRYGTH